MPEDDFEVAYWALLATSRRPRFWITEGWGLGFGNDEWHRRTFVLGHLVIALWQCGCRDCETDRAELALIVDRG